MRRVAGPPNNRKAFLVSAESLFTKICSVHMNL
jgi:hypothetical protein